MKFQTNILLTQEFREAFVPHSHLHAHAVLLKIYLQILQTRKSILFLNVYILKIFFIIL